MREEFDQLARAYAGAEHDTQRLEAAVALAVALAEAGELSRARDAARGAKRYALVLGDQRSRAIALLATGAVRRHDDDYLGALECLHDARYHAEGCGDVRLLARVLTAVSGAHYELGQYAHAIEELTVALGLAFEVEDERVESDVYRALAGVYSRLEDPVRADGYARRALFIARRRCEDRPMAESLVLLGNVAAREQERLFYANQPGDAVAGQRALAWYAEARPLARRLEDQTLEFRLVNNTARVMLYLDRPHDAARLLAAYLSGSHDLRPHQIAVLRFGMGEATLATDPQAALVILLEAVKLAEAHRAVNHIPKMHLAIANAYERLGETANALAHHKAYHQVERLVRGETPRAKATLAAIQLEAQEIRYASDRLRRASDAMTDHLESLQSQADKLDDRVRRDVLTELANRRAFDEWLDRLFGTGSGPVVSVALLDIDEFKVINDTHSHLVGDEVLRRVARILEAAVRLSDMAARYGGEEFGLVLPNTPLDEAAAVCERVRRAVAEADWALVRPGLRVTVSAGVSQECRPELALSVADQRLYAAKRGGRNRVIAG
ncbi:MAG TPA: GGDEF domain-containing protein [Mycobacteriales bacterium]|nr:GGDEF domain-containing protein [Mycobacteriales bacterium]